MENSGAVVDHAKAKNDLKNQLAQWKAAFRRKNGREHNKDGSDFDQSYKDLRDLYYYHSEQAKLVAATPTPKPTKKKQVLPEPSVGEAVVSSSPSTSLASPSSYATLSPRSPPAADRQRPAPARHRRGSLANTPLSLPTKASTPGLHPSLSHAPAEGHDPRRPTAGRPVGISRSLSKRQQSQHTLGWTKTSVSSSDVLEIVQEEIRRVGAELVRHELQRLVQAGVLTINGELPVSMPDFDPQQQLRAPMLVADEFGEGGEEEEEEEEEEQEQDNDDEEGGSNDDKFWVLDQSNKEGERVFERLGLPSFDELLDMPPEIVEKILRDKVDEWKVHGTIAEDVEEFVDIFISHHHLYKAEIENSANIRDIMDVYW